MPKSVIKSGLITVLMTFLLSWQLEAQSVLGNSPFSRFGLGELVPDYNVRNAGMGNTGLANPDPDFVNIQNPALLPFNKLTNIDLGLIYNSRAMDDGAFKHSSRGGSVNYIGLSLPLSKKVTSYIGFMPLSSVDYQMGVSSTFSDGRIFRTALNGTGGLNKVNLGVGFPLTKRLNIGFMPTVIFGNINNSTSYSISDPGTINAPAAVVQTSSSILDITGRMGINYRIPLDTLDRYFLSFGGYGELGRNMGGNRLNQVIYTPAAYTTQFRIGDTLASTSGTTSYPASFGVGFSFARLLSYTISADFKYSLNEGSTFNGVAAPYKNSWTAGIGGEWTPNAYSQNYLGICTYRVGFNMSQTPLVTRGNSVQDNSVSFGFTAPITRKEAKFTRPYISGALIFGQRGGIELNGLQENYIRFVFGVTLNDATWFKRYKHD